MIRSREARRAERGSATAEFALVLPLVLLVVVGVVQIGALLRDQQVVAQAAREGARVAAVDRSDAVAAAAVARVAGGDVQVGIRRSGGGGTVTVTATVVKNLAGPLEWLSLSPVRLVSSATMREEYSE